MLTMNQPMIVKLSISLTWKTTSKKFVVVAEISSGSSASKGRRHKRFKDNFLRNVLAFHLA